ncbi:hypothetical protein [Streptomyces caniscabiei]|uniref:Uncharacterized protein n=1 Tax=Streptomyces caniscabiei TaxID=2746961 RepID=A0ABU4N224_9ACTN|nr:hypothetical protein [Streptomyces caniscabiei]MBE4790253.1 hypothetical protein [Streptomyces caniscabiei]MBE4799518.1 hypothetical protein [Streptomyces caniscabiei]MDX3015238.1 hypothetical protein [Streptomyces caniscabiei]MDX3042553.1 hypothetical protein [Streptomyces caniscabiei]
MSTSTAEQIGPRVEGVVYYDGPRLVQVRRVVTDLAEARRILRRNAARFAIHVVDMHAGTDYYTGAIWTGSDRVLKAVAA